MIMRRKIVVLGAAVLGLACGDREAGSGKREAGSVPAATAVAGDTTPTILFLGTSLTAGLGVDPEDAYPALLRRRIDSLGLVFRIVNAGVSGETSAGGLRRIGWVLREPIAVLVVELGANDALRGQDPSATRRNLQAIIDSARRRDPHAAIVLAGMQAPPNLGPVYGREFQGLFVDLARENRAVLVPFLLEGVGGHPDLNQADGIHPTAAGHRIMADNVWRVLEPVLRSRDGGRGKREG
jgi:acyl-CoA thioesterase-1